jgi:hypothetical protein
VLDRAEVDRHSSYDGGANLGDAIEKERRVRVDGLRFAPACLKRRVAYPIAGGFGPPTETTTSAPFGAGPAAVNRDDCTNGWALRRIRFANCGAGGTRAAGERRRDACTTTNTSQR